MAMKRPSDVPQLPASRAVVGETLTLQQAIALYAFGNVDEPLACPTPSFLPELMVDIKREATIVDAANRLAEDINARKIPLRGWRIRDELMEKGEFENQNPIDDATLALGCHIALGFMIHDGGRLIFITGENSPLIKYRDVHLQEAAVRRLCMAQPDKVEHRRPGQGLVEKTMLDVSKRAYDAGDRLTVPEARSAVIEALGPTLLPGYRQLTAALKKVPNEYKRGIGDRRPPIKGT